MLLRNGAKVDARGPNKSTLLHSAAREGHSEITAQLIANGAELSAQDSLGETPLHKAARWERERCLQILIDRGADRFVKNSDGKLPFQVTNDYKCIVILRTRLLFHS